MNSKTQLAGGVISAAVVFTGLLAVTSATASEIDTAASYKCKTSKKSIDDPTYTGPWPDNWDFTVKVCAKRVGGYIHAYSKATWDGPTYSNVNDKGLFDAAGLRVYVKKSVAGPDPIVKYKTYLGIEKPLEKSNSWGNYNGSFTSNVVKHKAGKGRYIGDAAVKLNWGNESKGVRTYKFTASPRV